MASDQNILPMLCFEHYKGTAKNILVAGGTGFIGRRLIPVLLNHGHTVIVLTRKIPVQKEGDESLRYVVSLSELDNQCSLDVIINLAGEPLAGKRWTKARKKLFLASRLSVTREIHQMIERLNHRPDVLVNASAIGYYGPQGDEVLTEEGLAVGSFSHDLCDAWEKSAGKIENLGVRVCLLRIGIVLGEKGGPLAELKLPFTFGLAMQIASGSQWMSWIHRDDVISIILYLIETRLDGPINASAPEPITNSQFTDTMAGFYRTLIRFSVPAWLLTLFVGELANEVLVTGQRVVPDKLLSHGFEFLYPDLNSALVHLFEGGEA